jgi:hypothetical protein
MYIEPLVYMLEDPEALFEPSILTTSQKLTNEY